MSNATNEAERVETCTDCLGSGERTVADEDDEEC
jgi:hypothetical protein